MARSVEVLWSDFRFELLTFAFVVADGADETLVERLILQSLRRLFRLFFVDRLDPEQINFILFLLLAVVVQSQIEFKDELSVLVNDCRVHTAQVEAHFIVFCGAFWDNCFLGLVSRDLARSFISLYHNCYSFFILGVALLLRVIGQVEFQTKIFGTDERRVIVLGEGKPGCKQGCYGKT